MLRFDPVRSHLTIWHDSVQFDWVGPSADAIYAAIEHQVSEDRLNAAAPSVQPGDWVLVPREPTREMLDVSVQQPMAVKGSETDTIRWHLYRAMLAAAPAPSVAQSEREACPLCERDAASRPNSDEREGDDQRLLGLTKADPSALAWLKQLKVWAYWHYNERAAALYATHQARASAGSATTSTSDPIAPLSSYSFDELREGLRRMRAVRREQNRRSLWHRR